MGASGTDSRRKRRASDGGSTPPASTKLSVAHVGADRPFSEFDSARVAEAMWRIVQHGKIGVSGHDIINLNYGRDFLAETREYGIVIVHSVFDPQFGAQSLGDILFKETRTSPLHTYDAWRARLQSTRAEWIVVCEGQPACLSGWQLGDIPGYELVHIDTKTAVYQKNPWHHVWKEGK